MTEDNSLTVPVMTLLASVILFSFFYFFTEMSLYEILSIVALIGTAIIIAWYTIETYRLRVIQPRQIDIQLRQIDISILPSIVVFKTDKKDSFTIMNVGNGVAVNIKFDDTVLSEELDIRLRFPKVLSLFPRESELITIDSVRSDYTLDFPFDSQFDERYANRQWDVWVTFEDIARQKYRQTLILGVGGPYLGKIQKIDN